MSLPNPGFDASSFENTAFDCTTVDEPTVNNGGIDRDRRHQEWYVCDRCGWYYPRERMMMQNGLNLCSGVDTRNCMDLPGHAANVSKLDVPFELRPEPLPDQSEDL